AQHLAPDEVDEARVPDDVAAGEAPRFLGKAERPFQSGALRPARRALAHAGEHLEGSAHAHRERDSERIAVAGLEELLLRRAESDEEDVGPSRRDPLDDRLLVARREEPVLRAGDPDRGMPPLDLGAGAREHARLASEEVDG